jgi:hypothetical protein
MYKARADPVIAPVKRLKPAELLDEPLGVAPITAIAEHQASTAQPAGYGYGARRPYSLFTSPKTDQIKI